MKVRQIAETPFRNVQYGNKRQPDRMRSDKIGAVRDKCENRNILVGVQGFWSPVSMDDEPHSCPIFFVFNSKKTSLSDEEALELSAKEASSALGFFRDNFELSDADWEIFFSGKRGFHMCLSPEVSGAGADAIRIHVSGRFASFLRDALSLETLDISAYRDGFSLRLDGSRHPDTDLFCTEISPSELSMPPKDMLSLAAARRDPPDKGEIPEAKINEGLRGLIAEFSDEQDRLTVLAGLSPVRPIKEDPPTPVCMDFVSKISGTANQAAIRYGAASMAAYYKDAGVGEGEASVSISSWSVLAIDPDSEPTTWNIGEWMKARVRAISEWIYGNDDIHFSCSFMRALGKPLGRPVPCSRGACKVANEADQQPKTPPNVELDRAADPALVGRTMKVKAVVTGATYKNYLGPQMVRVTCRDEGKTCDLCPLKGHGGTSEKPISADDIILLEIARASKAEVRMAVREKLGIPFGCKSPKIEFSEFQGMYDLSLQPVIKIAPEIMSKDRPYVVQEAMLVGDGIKLVGESREYELEARLYPHPKDQSAILQVTGAKPIEDFVSQFRMSKELADKLKVFQPAKGQSEWDKLLEIWEDLTFNVVKIYDRLDMGLIMDLSYHSVTAFYWDGDVQKGWVDALIVGDTGQGKTHMAKRLINHYGLGVFVNGESASRTGLLYALEQFKTGFKLQWGAIPLNDRRLVFIDEFTGIKDEDREQLTAVRSEGFLEVHKIIKAKAMARTRLVFMCNPKDGRRMSQFNYGVDAIETVFRKPEDVRRLDIADVVAIGEVDNKRFSEKQEADIEHIHLSSLCKHLVLWAWSRKPEQVEITPDAEKAIREAQDRIQKRYVPDIPLCEPSSLVQKVARLSIAVAARLFSNRDRDAVLVKREHVECAVRILEGAYSKRAMSYLAKSTAILRDQEIVKANRDATEEYLRERFQDPKERSSFINCMLRMGRFTKSELSEFVPLGKDDYNNFFKNLTMNRMIEKRGPQWAKSVHFTELLRKMDAEADWKSEDRPKGGEQSPRDHANDAPPTAEVPEWLYQELEGGRETGMDGEQ